MAFTAVVPATMNVNITQTLAQAFQSTPVVNFAAAVVDLSAWVSLVAQLAPPTPNPTGAPVSFGTVTANSSGVITLQTSATDLDTVAAGSARLIITGKPTSGDIAQVICTGTAQVQSA
jgi:hypothetical protein